MYVNKNYALDDKKRTLPRLQSMDQLEGRVLNKAHNKRETLLWSERWSKYHGMGISSYYNDGTMVVNVSI